MTRSRAFPLLVLGFVAACGLQEARQSGNEASAIGSLRAINSAQAAYSAVCSQNGYAASLEDLAKAPSGSSNPFISPDLSVNGVEKSGYVITVRPGVDAAKVIAEKPTCNGTEPVSTYFATAVPRSREVGGRSFATDERGDLYFRTDGAPIEPGMRGAERLQ
jgi:type IV pilus assembly protein PilA